MKQPSVIAWQQEASTMTAQLQYRSTPGAGLTRVRINRRRRRVLLALFVGMETPGAFSLGRLARVGPGSVYPFLAHLERAGWVTSEWETVPPGEDRLRRRFYTLTPLGRSEGGRLLGLVSIRDERHPDDPDKGADEE
jgi:PadR family transcriptional regulator PadR